MQTGVVPLPPLPEVPSARQLSCPISHTYRHCLRLVSCRCAANMPQVPGGCVRHCSSDSTAQSAGILPTAMFRVEREAHVLQPMECRAACANDVRFPPLSFSIILGASDYPPCMLALGFSPRETVLAARVTESERRSTVSACASTRCRSPPQSSALASQRSRRVLKWRRCKLLRCSLHVLSTRSCGTSCAHQL